MRKFSSGGSREETGRTAMKPIVLGTRLAAFWLLLLTGGGPGLKTEAYAQASEPPAKSRICVTKRDSSGGWLGFVVKPSAAGKFRNAGFSIIPCPAAADKAPGSTPFVCEHLRGLGERSRQVIMELYGISVDEMCEEVDRWVAAPDSEEQE